MKYEDMTYDEQRAFLGLPDVSGYVAHYRLQVEWNRIKRVSALIGEALGMFGRTIDIQDQSGYALGGEK